MHENPFDLSPDALVQRIGLPRPMIERFTPRAQIALLCGQHEAMRFNHEFLGTEHLLLGILKEGHSEAARFLEKCGLSVLSARLAVERLFHSEIEMLPPPVPFTPTARRVLKSAVDGNSSCPVTTELLLESLLARPMSAANLVLEDCGIRNEVVLGRLRDQRK
jgi:ATP-dependent Clp protease ATP-binding subunit ClpC